MDIESCRRFAGGKKRSLEGNSRDFLGGPEVKNPPSNAGDSGLIAEN